MKIPKIVLRDFLCQCCNNETAKELVVPLDMQTQLMGLDARLEMAKLQDELLCEKCESMRVAIDEIANEC